MARYRGAPIRHTPYTNRPALLEQRRKLHECQPDPKKPPIGEHTWKLFKQRVQPDIVTDKRYQYETRQVLTDRSGAYTGGDGWYFVVRACESCHTKQYLDYRKER